MRRTAESTFDEWACNGRDEGMEKGHFPRAVQVLEALRPNQGESFIDLGCGNGWASRWIHEVTGPTGNVVGIDVAANMIRRARELTTTTTGLRFDRAAFEDLPFESESFDGAFSMEAIYYSTDLRLALTSICRVLKPGGTFGFCTDFFQENPYCHDWPEGLGIPMELLSEGGWCEFLEKAGFEIIRCFRCFDTREANGPVDDATIDFRTRIGALGVLATKPMTDRQ